MHSLLRNVASRVRDRARTDDQRRERSSRVQLIARAAPRDPRAVLRGTRAARPSTRSSLIAALAMCAGTLASCASSSHAADGAKDGGAAIRIQWVNYGSAPGALHAPAGAKTDQRFELIDQSRSKASDVYSKTRKLEEASTKVTTDEILKETLAFFESKGFFEKAESGPAPASGAGGILRAIEVETPDRFVHLTIQKGFTQPEMTRFMDCQKAFFDIYNNTYQLQAVDRAPDWEAQNPGGAKKKPNG